MNDNSPDKPAVRSARRSGGRAGGGNCRSWKLFLDRGADPVEPWAAPARARAERMNHTEAIALLASAAGIG